MLTVMEKFLKITKEYKSSWVDLHIGADSLVSFLTENDRSLAKRQHGEMKSEDLGLTAM